MTTETNKTAVPAVVFPVVHLNGTSKTALLDNLNEVWVAVDEAMKKLCQAAPNGRDYYPRGADHPMSYEAARTQHDRRMAILRDLKTNICEEMDAIEDANR